MLTLSFRGAELWTEQNVKNGTKIKKTIENEHLN